MKTIEITRKQFDEFKQLQVRKRWDWPATFSANPAGQIWPYVTNGPTPDEKRDYVQGVSTLLDQVAAIYTAHREEGGRFFIGWKGAFYRSEDDDSERQIILWDFGVDLQPAKNQQTYKELRELQMKAPKIRKK